MWGLSWNEDNDTCQVPWHVAISRVTSRIWHVTNSKKKLKKKLKIKKIKIKNKKKLKNPETDTWQGS